MADDYVLIKIDSARLQTTFRNISKLNTLAARPLQSISQQLISNSASFRSIFDTPQSILPKRIISISTAYSPVKLTRQIIKKLNIPMASFLKRQNMDQGNTHEWESGNVAHCQKKRIHVEAWLQLCTRIRKAKLFQHKLRKISKKIKISSANSSQESEWWEKSFR